MQTYLTLDEIPQFTLNREHKRIVLVENHPLLGLVISQQYISDLNAVIPEIKSKTVDIGLRLPGGAWLGTKKHPALCDISVGLSLENLIDMVRETMDHWHFMAMCGEGGQSTQKILTRALEAPFSHVICTKVEIVEAKSAELALCCWVETMRNDYRPSAHRARKGGKGARK